MLEILVIDDLRDDLLLVERTIRQAGFQNPVHLFQDPAQLISHFHALPDADPALMFVDLVMFPRNGIEILKALKNFPRAAHSISVMLSGMSDVRNIRLAYEAGATTFLIKPITAGDINNFFRAFTRYFDIRESQAGRFAEWAASFRKPMKRDLSAAE
jgi:DNA-binding NtrC family response regulator